MQSADQNYSMYSALGYIYSKFYSENHDCCSFLIIFNFCEGYMRMYNNIMSTSIHSHINLYNIIMPCIIIILLL